MDFNENYTQCPKGHWYDPSVHKTCPQCQEEMMATMPSDSGFGKTEPVEGINFSWQDPGPTVDSGVGFSSIGKTEPFSIQNFDDVGRQSSPSGIDEFPPSGPRPADIGITEPISDVGIHNFSPVVGWLVCIDGPEKGKDYRLHSGYNNIGRSPEMDVCILGDNKISRDKHCMVAFDPEGGEFYFGPVSGINLVKLNKKLVMMPTEIHAYDELLIGSSRFKFVPFCGESFSWEEN